MWNRIFLVLYFRPQNFYSPLDFRSDETYIAVQEQRSGLAGIAKYFAEGKETKNAQESHNTQSSSSKSIIEGIGRETVFYLLKVANTNISILEHMRILKQEVPKELLEAVKSPLTGDIEATHPHLTDVMESVYVIGFLTCLWINLSNSIIDVVQFQQEDIANVMIKISPDILKQLGEKVGKAI